MNVCVIRFRKSYEIKKVFVSMCVSCLSLWVLVQLIELNILSLSLTRGKCHAKIFSPLLVNMLLTPLTRCHMTAAVNTVSKL